VTQLNTLSLEMLSIHTLLILFLVSLAVLLIGGALAWLTTYYQFPGRKLFSKLFILPLAIPSYILGFLFLDITTQQTIPNLSTANNLLALSTLFALVKTCFLYSATLFPLVYLPAQKAFKRLNQSQHESLHILGLSQSDVLFHVHLPKSRSSIIAGVLLASLIVLSDFATPSMTGFPTLASSIYSFWEQHPNSDIAWIPATALLLMGLVSFLLLTVLRGKSEPDSTNEAYQPPIKLSGMTSISASLTCLSVVFLTLIFPLIQLLSRLNIGQVSDHFQALLPYLSNSTILSLTASMFTVCLIILIIVAIKSTVLLRQTSTLIALVNSFPMPFLVMISLFILQGLPALMLVYIIHLLPVAMNIIRSGQIRTIMKFTELTESLGLPYFKKIGKIYLPVMALDISVAILLTTFMVFRELPASYFLLPAGWETLAVQCFKLVSSGSPEQAALAASMVILAGLVPVAWLIHNPSNLSRTI